jgi:dihydrofolate synthase / folylpolyglutamate synthase
VSTGRTSDYDTALDYLSSLADFERTGRFTTRVDVAPMLELLSELGNPQLGRLTVHVAGSKGKGSVAALIESMLRASGLRTGLYTSPHLTSFTERIQIAGAPVSEEEFARGLHEIAPAVQQVQQRWPGRQLVTFDVLTALGFHLFQQRGVEAQVIEVGLGGLLDSTNVFTRKECSVITRIGLEHQDVLGNTLTAIARQKAGIITAGGPTVMGAQPEEAAAVIRATAFERAAPLCEAAQLVTVEVLRKDAFAQQLRLRTRNQSYEAELRLLGAHQLDNAATAVSAIEVLSQAGVSVPPSAVEWGLAAVHWPARIEVVRREPLVVVDVAHTVDSARSLSETLVNDLRVDRAILVVGAMRDKDLSGLAQEMAARAQHVIATQSNHPRSLPAEAVLELFRALGLPCSSQPTVAGAVDAALARADGTHPVVIFGSVALAGEARSYLLGAAAGAPGMPR